MNQENAYSKGCKVKYLLKSKTSVDLVGLTKLTLVFFLFFFSCVFKWFTTNHRTFISLNVSCYFVNFLVAQSFHFVNDG